MTNLELIIQRIDSISITGYPVDEQKVITKCSLISKGINILDSLESDCAYDQVREFIKRIYWFGFELGSNKALEMSEYAGKQVFFFKKAIHLGMYSFSENEAEIIPYLELLQSLEQDHTEKEELEQQIIKYKFKLDINN